LKNHAGRAWLGLSTFTFFLSFISRFFENIYLQGVDIIPPDFDVI